ncbi:alpha/beta hydrolase [Streptomyces diastaticus]
MNAAVSLEAVAVLATTGAVAVLDVPGQPGLSAGHRPHRARLPWYGHWLSQALEQVATGPAIVVGHSLGAAIALAAHSPHITGRLLLSPGGVTRLAVPASVLRATLPWVLRSAEHRSRRLLREMSAPGHAVPEQLVEWMTLVGRSCRSTLAPSPLPSHVLRRARPVPCVVAVGSHDVFLPSAPLGRATRRLLGAEAHVLDGAGHLDAGRRPPSRRGPCRTLAHQGLKRTRREGGRTITDRANVAVPAFPAPAVRRPGAPGRRRPLPNPLLPPSRTTTAPRSVRLDPARPGARTGPPRHSWSPGDRTSEPATPPAASAPSSIPSALH